MISLDESGGAPNAHAPASIEIKAQLRKVATFMILPILLVGGKNADS
jgi:hypothetical protein